MILRVIGILPNVLIPIFALSQCSNFYIRDLQICKFHLGYNYATYRIKNLYIIHMAIRDIFRVVVEALWFSVP